MKSYVYVITDGSGWCKVGKANNVYKRLKGLQIGNPRKLKISFKYPCRNPSRAIMLEALTHASLADCRGIGEWFKCSTQFAAQTIREMAAKHHEENASRQNRRKLIKEEDPVGIEPIEIENVLETEGLCD